MKKFRALVYGYYARHGRKLPWRTTYEPYHIIVSEIMLQQTQVSRVLVKYPVFLREFPTPGALARAPLRQVLAVWQGMGYNRRALALKKIAQVLVREYGGMVPDDRDALRKLPGIGEATSGAVCAYAFNKPEVFIETNIRSVFLHHFFRDKEGVCDADLLPIIYKELDRKNPRKWYSALMDYGTHLKSLIPNPGRKSLHYRPQGRFEGSNRQVRGKILAELLKTPRLSQILLSRKLGMPQAKIKPVLTVLCREKLLSNLGNYYYINR